MKIRNNSPLSTNWPRRGVYRPTSLQRASEN